MGTQWVFVNQVSSSINFILLTIQDGWELVYFKMFLSTHCSSKYKTCIPNSTSACAWIGQKELIDFHVHGLILHLPACGFVNDRKFDILVHGFYVSLCVDWTVNENNWFSCIAGSWLIFSTTTDCPFSHTYAIFSNNNASVFFFIL